MRRNVANKPLKIAMLIRNYSASGGGAERYCVELTKRLAQQHEVHIFSQKNTESSKHITFHKIPRWFKRPRYVNQLLFSFLTRRATQNQGFDIVHSHDMVTHANIYTLHVPCVKTKWIQAYGAKKVLRWLGTLLSPRKMAYLWLEQREMRTLPNRHFISVSEYLSRNILANYPKLKGNITIAHPGINAHSMNDKQIATWRKEFRNTHHIPDSAFILLFVAHGFKRKGLPSIIAALEILEDEQIHLIVAGNGDPEEISINSLLVKKNTHFIGVVKAMDELYPAADALIHPTLGDTYGMAVLEAMSHGLPVVVSGGQYCGLSEQLQYPEAILLDSPTNPIEIKTKIASLYKNPQLIQTVSIAGQQKASIINWQKTLDNTLKSYGQIKE